MNDDNVGSGTEPNNGGPNNGGPNGGMARRDVLKGVGAMAVAAPLVARWQSPAQAAEPKPPADVSLTWLEGKPAESPGSTWGVPWPKGAVAADQSFALTTADGSPVPTQTWPLAYWPDGTLKWSAHAIGPASTAERLVLKAGAPADPESAITVVEKGDHIDVGTGVIDVRIPRRGTDLISHIKRGGTTVARDGRLVNLVQRGLLEGDNGSVERHRLFGSVESVTVEQSGPVRAVVRVEGKHRDRRNRHRGWLPFTVRLYFYAGAESVRMVHSFVFDSDGSDGRDGFVAGLGIRFSVPMRDELYNRHIRLVGQEHGMLAEAVRPITGLRRDPGEEVREAQAAGRETPDISTWDPRVSDRMHWIPTWGDFTLSQLNSEGFAVQKRTKAGQGWIPVDQGKRAAGFGYVGGISGGLAFGMRDFWKLHPTQLDIRDAATEAAEVTVWMWSPEAGPMDARFYHDGLGQDTYEKQLDALEVTYEDYEPKFDTPYGVARTTELLFWALEATPDAGRLGNLADVVRTPPQLAAPPEHLASTGVFGGLFAPVDRSSQVKAEIEDHLDFLFDYYVAQQEQRHWYGFWNYGDVMHTQDTDRKVWRYDIGGYAWDNSELSPDLWLWFAYLRSGRADIYRFAEAMTRHTGEVDVYHVGEWRGLGTRHGVQHWGDSAKQLRISNANYRRHFYFLTADERVGDLLHELVDSEATFLVLDPIRKIREEPYEPDPEALAIGFGTDWSALAAAWLTEWERRGPKWREARAKVLGTMRTIGAQPNGFIQGGGLYNMKTREFAVPDEPAVGVSHLSAMFGLVEVNAELIDLVDVPEFEAAWLQYCRLYQAPAKEQEAEVGESWSKILNTGHTRLEAYAAVRLGEDKYANRAWRTFFDPPNSWEYAHDFDWSAERVDSTLNPTDWAAWVVTNETALYGLAAIQNLALIDDNL